MLETAFAAFGAARGSGLRKAAIEAKRAAYAAGAQDAVLLASLSDGGLPLPLDGIEEADSDPLHLSLAVRHAGYWARGLASFGTANSAAAASADAALSGLIALMRPRLSVASLTVAAPQLLGAYRPHPLTVASAAAGIGLSLEEFPSEPNAPLVAGGVYALRVGAAGEGGDQALASAMIALNADGAHVLWRSPAPGRS
jgi:hypothetical protein